MSKRRNVQFIGDEPSFIRQFKAKIGYKEGPTVDTKRQKLELNDEDDDRPETEDEKPMVVVLQSGDLTAEEAEKLQKIHDDEEAIHDGKIKFKKPKKGDDFSKDDLESADRTKGSNDKEKQKKKKKKDKTNSNLLSFGADEEDG